MHRYLTVVFGFIAAAGAIAVLSSADAAPLKPSPEDRYVATRNAAIAKFSPVYDAGKSDDATTKAEDAVFADLKAQMAAILGEPDRKGFGPAKLNIETFYKGDEGFGTLDGLRLTGTERGIYLIASAIPLMPARPFIAIWRSMTAKK